jgi:DNA-binding protein HU-beta
MYNSALVTILAYRLRLSEAAVNGVMTAVFDHITDVLAEGETVVFTGFGTFYTSHRPAGEVPQGHTGKTVTFPAHRVAAFRAGERLKRAVRTLEEAPAADEARHRRQAGADASLTERR